MSLPREHSQENLSIAYISAVAAKAGFMCQRQSQDYGTDIEVGIVEQIGNNRIDTGYRLCIPAILVLYCMPANDDDWLSVYENCTTLKHCGYWISLKGKPESNNSSTQSIKIPKEQMFTESTLTSIMEHIKNGEVL